jgi:hypothetical protein
MDSILTPQQIDKLNFSIKIPMQQNPVGVLALREYLTDSGELWKRIAPYFGAYDFLLFEYASGFTDWQVDWLFNNMTRRTYKKLCRALGVRKPLS